MKALPNHTPIKLLVVIAALRTAPSAIIMYRLFTPQAFACVIVRVYFSLRLFYSRIYHLLQQIICGINLVTHAVLSFMLRLILTRHAWLLWALVKGLGNLINPAASSALILFSPTGAAFVNT